MKHPILMIGILFMFIFLYGLHRRGYFAEYRNKLNPTSCRAAMVKLKRLQKEAKLDKDWSLTCDGNNLSVESYLKIPETVNTQVQIKSALYKELANTIIRISKAAPGDNLERIDMVRMRLDSQHFTINGLTTGRQMVKFRTIKTPQLIAEHLKATVQIQEVVKTK